MALGLHVCRQCHGLHGGGGRRAPWLAARRLELQALHVLLVESSPEGPPGGALAPCSPPAVSGGAQAQPRPGPAPRQAWSPGPTPWAGPGQVTQLSPPGPRAPGGQLSGLERRPKAAGSGRFGGLPAPGWRSRPGARARPWAPGCCARSAIPLPLASAVGRSPGGGPAPCLTPSSVPREQRERQEREKALRLQRELEEKKRKVQGGQGRGPLGSALGFGLGALAWGSWAGPALLGRVGSGRGHTHGP